MANDNKPAGSILGDINPISSEHTPRTKRLTIRSAWKNPWKAARSTAIRITPDRAI